MSVVRVDDGVYGALLAIKHELEAEANRSASMSDAVREAIRRFLASQAGERRREPRCVDGYTHHRYAWTDRCVRCGAPKLAATKAREEARRDA